MHACRSTLEDPTFESLTGRPPFEAATLEGLFHAILGGDAPTAHRVNAEVPLDLAVIAATAIEKEPERRYKTALDLALDLERFVRMEPIQARPITRLQRALRWSRRNPALAGSLLAVVVLGLVATGLLSYGVGASGRAALEAELRGRAEKEQARLVQVAADRELAGRMDELAMKFGTLMFGYEVGDAASMLLPAFSAVLREAGIDLRGPDAVATGKARIEALRARDPDAARALLDLLRGLTRLQSADAVLEQNLARLLAEFQDPHMAKLSEAFTRWVRDRVDEFDPVLTQQSLRRLQPDQLADLASMLMVVDGRQDTALHLLDKALLRQPDSYGIHYLRAGMSIKLAASDLASEKAIGFVQQAVEHFLVATALRPRSGLARAALASSLALRAALTHEDSGYVLAQETMQSAVEVDPKNELVYYLQAQFLSRAPQGRKAAIAACRKALQIEPKLGLAQKLLDELMK